MRMMTNVYDMMSCVVELYTLSSFITQPATDSAYVLLIILCPKCPHLKFPLCLSLAS